MEINYEAIRKLLIQVKMKINEKINAIDLTASQKAILAKADKIITTGDGLSYLADNGEYIKIDLENLSDIYKKSQDVIDLFKIVKIDEGWVVKEPPTTSLANSASQLYENKIYSMAGNVNLCYDIENNSWSSKTGKIESDIIYYSSIIYKNKIYCIGGFNTTNRSSVIDNKCYDIATDTWSSKSNMFTGRYHLTSSIYINKIYCIGGNTDGLLANKNECYDILTDTWSTKTPLTSADHQLTSQSFENKIYCIGGQQSNNRNRCYDIATDTWSSKANKLTGTWNSTSSIYKDKIYCIGGAGGPTKNECYDIATDTWSSKLETLGNRSGISSCIFGNNIYLIGSLNEVYSIPVTDYELALPEDQQSKIDLLSIAGDGTKVLADNGQYISYNKEAAYRAMTNEEVTTLINELKTI